MLGCNYWLKWVANFGWQACKTWIDWVLAGTIDNPLLKIMLHRSPVAIDNTIYSIAIDQLPTIHCWSNNIASDNHCVDILSTTPELAQKREQHQKWNTPIILNNYDDWFLINNSSRTNDAPFTNSFMLNIWRNWTLKKGSVYLEQIQSLGLWIWWDKIRVSRPPNLVRQAHQLHTSDNIWDGLHT